MKRLIICACLAALAACSTTAEDLRSQPYKRSEFTVAGNYEQVYRALRAQAEECWDRRFLAAYNRVDSELRPASRTAEITWVQSDGVFYEQHDIVLDIAAMSEEGTAVTVLASDNFAASIGLEDATRWLNGWPGCRDFWNQPPPRQPETLIKIVPLTTTPAVAPAAPAAAAPAAPAAVGAPRVTNPNVRPGFTY